MNIVNSECKASIRATLTVSRFFHVFLMCCITAVVPKIVFGDTNTQNEKITEYIRGDRDYENLPEYIKKNEIRFIT